MIAPGLRNTFTLVIFFLQASCSFAQELIEVPDYKALTIIGGQNDSVYNWSTDDGTDKTDTAVPSGTQYKTYRATNYTSTGHHWLEYSFTPGTNGIAALAKGKYSLSVQIWVLGINNLSSLGITVNGTQIHGPVNYPLPGTNTVYSILTSSFGYNGGPLTIRFSADGTTAGDRIRLVFVEIRPELSDTANLDDPTNLVLENTKQKLIFTAQGQLLGMLNKQTNTQYIANPMQTTPFFKLQIIPSPGFDPTIINNKGFSLQPVAAGQRLVFNFSVGSADEILVDCIIDLDDSDKTTWRMIVTNNSPSPVVRQTFPCIANLRIGSSEADDILLWPRLAGLKISDPVHSLVDSTIHYIGQATMQWASLYDSSQSGIYIGSHDTETIDMDLVYEAQSSPANSSAINLAKYAFIGPGCSWQSPPFIVGVFKGDWHNAADIYKNWANTWMSRPQVPKWVKTFEGFYQMSLQWYDGPWTPDNQCFVRYYFRDIPSIFDSAVTANRPVMILPGQMIRGACYRYYAPDPYLGLEDELKAINEEITAKGGSTFYYANGMNWDAEFPQNLPSQYIGRINTALPQIPDWRQFADDCCIRDHDGNHTVQYPGPGQWNFRIMCPASSGWQNYLNYWTDKYVGEFKATGIMTDQVGTTYFGHCYNFNHDHSHHGCTAKGYYNLVKKLNETGRAINPDFATYPEGLADILGQVTMFQNEWNGYWDMQGTFPDLYRYTFDWQILLSNPTEAQDWNTCWLLGIRGSCPANAKAIRLAVRDIYLDSVYRGDEGVLGLPVQVQARVHEYKNGTCYSIPIIDSRIARTGYTLQLDETLYPGATATARVYYYPAFLSGSRMELGFSHSGGQLRISVPDSGGQDTLSGMLVVSQVNLPVLGVSFAGTVAKGVPFEIRVTSIGSAVPDATVMIGNKSYKTDADGVAHCVINDYAGRYIITAQKDGYLSAVSSITSTFSTTWQCTDNSKNNWTNPENWTNGSPVNGCTVNLTSPGKAACLVTATPLACKDLQISSNFSAAQVEVNNGRITSFGTCWLGNLSGGTGKLTAIGDSSWLGFNNLKVGNFGTGVLNMQGGFISAKTVKIPWTSSGNGTINLDHGIIDANSFTIREFGGTGKVNITAGRIIIDANVTSRIAAYVANGWITAYDGNGKVKYDFNSSTKDRTTVYAVAAADINQSSRVDFYDLALLIKQWGTPVGDLTGDHIVNSLDLFELCGQWLYGI